MIIKDTNKYGRRLSPKEQKRADRIDLGLAISAMGLRPGETRTAEHIAFFCGCRKANIQRIEKVALKKMRVRLIALLDENQCLGKSRET